MPVTNGSTNGISGGYDGDSLALRIIIGAFIALAWYNAVELNVLILSTFKRYSGWYFWSLVASAWGVIFYGIGFLFKFFQIVQNNYVNVTLIIIGWCSMVTGQSVVLWSRLHLICLNKKLLRRIAWMIVIDSFIFQIPITVLVFGSNANGSSQAHFVQGYKVMEKVQMAGFCIQEFIISSIYLWECVKFLRIGDQRKSRKTLYGLFYINVLIIIMDLAILGLECANLYILQIVSKGLVYSIKLKLEFVILGKLVQYVKPSSGNIPIAGTAAFEADISDLFPVESNSHSSGIPNVLPQLRVPHKRECTCYEEEIPGVMLEHIENMNGRNPNVPRDALSAPKPLRSSEDDIEDMMRRYSVPDE